jgi:hypothetical protein
MVRGRDAADVAMITIFGDDLLTHLMAWTDEIYNSLSEPELDEVVQTRPISEALALERSSGRLHL